MAEIDYSFKLATYSADKKLAITGMYLVDGYVTFRIEMKSFSFSGTDSFCSNKRDIDAFCTQMTDMYNTLKGEAILYDYDSDNYLKFEMHYNGSLTLSGQLGGSHNEHFVKFSFDTDQTAIPSFIGHLNKLFAL